MLYLAGIHRAGERLQDVHFVSVIRRMDANEGRELSGSTLASKKSSTDISEIVTT